LRLFEYDSQETLDDAVVKNNKLVVDFPHSAVIFLRHTRNTPNEMETIIRTPGGNVFYEFPIMKAKKYTLEEIFEKKLSVEGIITEYEKRTIMEIKKTHYELIFLEGLSILLIEDI